MTKRKLPKVGYHHLAARRRGNMLRGISPFRTAKETIRDFEQQFSTEFSLADRREFFAGWRIAPVTEAVERLTGIAQDLNADDLEQLGNELQDLANLWERRLDGEEDDGIPV